MQPELTKHCRLCDACVLGLDHHCLFLTRCVAVNNHRAFVFFMFEVMLANVLYVRAAITCEYITLFLDVSLFSLTLMRKSCNLRVQPFVLALRHSVFLAVKRLNMDLAKAKSEALDNIYSSFKHIKSCNAKRRRQRRRTVKNNNRSN